MFIDQATVLVQAGKGGDGKVSFRRERYISKGGPDGGDGGNGGDVVVLASVNQNTLASFRYQKELHAEDGASGGNAKKHGKAGIDLVVPVPVGTQVFVDGELVADLTEDGQRTVIAKGGKGGFGNAHFTSSTRQTPRFAEKGEEGEAFEAQLELKIIADVGLVGMPNAGKSTLLSKISSARPKIANYPFTTLHPHLGVVTVDKGSELLVADIPGLIDGASEGKGLGDEFLRHVERTQVLLHMIDAYSNDVAGDYKTIQNELASYKIDLTKKPQIVALTKIEGLDEEILADQVATLKKVTKNEIVCISAVSGDGLQALLYRLKQVVDELKAKKPTEKALPIIQAIPNDELWEITVEETGVRVRGIKIERFAKRTDFTSEDGVQRLRDIMRKLGIAKALERKKLELGTKIFFGDDTENYLEY